MEEAEDIDNWPSFLLATTCLGAVVVTALHLLQQWLLGTGVPFLGLVGVLPGTLLAVSAIISIFRAQISLRRDPRAIRPYVIGAIGGIAMIALNLEAFSGLTAFFWQYLASSASESTEASPLWSCEYYFAWHLANTIPMLEVPDAFAWPQPHLAVEHWSGVLLMAFKVLLISPLIQIALAGYRLTESRWRNRGPAQGNFTFAPSIWRTIGVFSLCLGGLVASLLLLILALDRYSLIHGWISDWLGEGLQIPGWNITTTAVQATTDCVVALLMIAALGIGIFASLADLVYVRIESAPVALINLLSYIMLIATAVVVAISANLAMLHATVAGATPDILGESDIAAAASWTTWHLADIIPGLEITKSLDWTLDTNFSSWGPGVILILLKIAILILLVPVGLLAGAFWHRVRD